MRKISVANEKKSYEANQFITQFTVHYSKIFDLIVGERFYPEHNSYNK